MTGCNIFSMTMSPGARDASTAVRLTASERRELAQIASDVPPGNMKDEKRRVYLKNLGLAYRDESRPWLWHLTDEGAAILRSCT
jgi:hypothetical protein